MLKNDILRLDRYEVRQYEYWPEDVPGFTEEKRTVYELAIRDA